MSRWLHAAQKATDRPTIPTKGDRTPPEAVLPKPDPVLFGFVGFVGGGNEPCTNPDTSPRAAIILALRRGMKTPGSIASAAMLGATDTYQELDRMMSDGILSMQTNGALSLVVAPDPEANQ